MLNILGRVRYEAIQWDEDKVRDKMKCREANSTGRYNAGGIGLLL